MSLSKPYPVINLTDKDLRYYTDFISLIYKKGLHVDGFKNGFTMNNLAINKGSSCALLGLKTVQIGDKAINVSTNGIRFYPYEDMKHWIDRKYATLVNSPEHFILFAKNYDKGLI